VVTEVMNIEDVGLVSEYADMLQIGARNMQNYGLLEMAGRTMRPVLLKRGLSSTVEEWLLAAEYILSQGNSQVVLCERGIRTFETYTRFTLDISAVPLARELSHLPVVVDPSQATGRWSLVTPMASAALASDADGLIVEVHPHPDHALSDGAQSLTPKNFNAMMERLRTIATAMERRI
jgi:3-deoxy-7-phosphoheptulonate synthase